MGETSQATSIEDAYLTQGPKRICCLSHSSQFSPPEFHLLPCDLSCFLPLPIFFFLIYPFPLSLPSFPPSLSHVQMFGQEALPSLPYILNFYFLPPGVGFVSFF